MDEEQNVEQKISEYNQLIQLYSTYLHIIIQLGVFSFAVIGGIVSYSLSNIGITRMAILMPMLFSYGLAFIFYKSIGPSKELEKAFTTLGDKILKVELKPHSYLLRYGVLLFMLLYVFISIGLTLLVCCFIFQCKALAVA